MKKIYLIITFIMLSYSVFAQSPYDQMRNFWNSKDYSDAAKYINDAIKSSPKNQDVYVLAGDIYFELEKPDQALEMYIKADDLDGGKTTIIRKIGRAYSALGKHLDAIKTIKKAIKLEPGDVYNQLELGEAYIKADSIDQATLTITKARELNKKIAQPYKSLGDLYFVQKIYELAKNNYEEALKIDPELTDARIKLAQSYYWMANIEPSQELSNELFNRSLNEWNIVSKKDPKNARAWWEQSRILYFAKRYDMSAGALIKYLELRPEQKLARWYLAQSYYELGQCDSAIVHLKIAAAELDSIKDKAELKMAKCYFDLKMYKESMDVYQKLHQANKLDIKDIEKMAAASLKLGDTLGTISYYKEVLTLDPTRCNLMYQLANLTIFMKKYNEAIYFLDKRLANCKDSLTPKIYYLLGTCYFGLEKIDTTMFLLKKSLELEPNNITAKIYLGDVYSNLKEKDLAKEEFAAAIKMGMADTSKYKREITQAYLKLSSTLLDAKNFKELLVFAKQWTEYDPNSSYAWLYEGVGYQGQSDKDNACRCYKKGAALDPTNQFFKKSLKSLECN